jgi:phospholipid/cholesterol/gamma-HCH transport system substrate-binding protein
MSGGTTAALVKLMIFGVVTVTMTAVLAQTLGSVAFGAGGTTYRARFTDVTGLLPRDDIRIAGVKVGQVTGIELVDNSVAEVSFTLDEEVRLPTSVRAVVRYRNLVGQRYIALREGPGGAERLPRGGVIPLTQTTPALDLTALFNGFMPLFSALSPDDINKLSYEIIQVLQGEAGTVTSLLNHTAALTSVLAERDTVIARVVTNLNLVLATVDEHDAELDRTVRQLQAFVTGLSGDRLAVGAALASIGELTAATAGLLTEARPSLAADLELLDRLAGNLNNNSERIGRTLDNLPGRLDALSTTMSNGNWVDIYACEVFFGTIQIVNRTAEPQCRQ